RLGVDLVDALVVDLDLEVLRPAAVAAKPAARACLGGRTVHGGHCMGSPSQRPDSERAHIFRVIARNCGSRRHLAGPRLRTGERWPRARLAAFPACATPTSL